MKLTEEQQESFVKGMMMFTAIAMTIFAAGLIVSSAITILAINSLMASEIIPLTYASVFSLAWLKFVVLWFLNRVSIVKRNET